MNLTKDDFTADGIHPNLNGTSIIMHKISSHIPDCFISTDFVAEREYSSVKVEYKYGCNVCCKDHYTADCDKFTDQKQQREEAKEPTLHYLHWQMTISNSHRAVNPTTRRYSSFTNNYKSKSRIDGISIPSKTANKVLRTNFIETSWIEFSSGDWADGA